MTVYHIETWGGMNHAVPQNDQLDHILSGECNCHPSIVEPMAEGDPVGCVHKLVLPIEEE